jgi:hypothetical protein
VKDLADLLIQHGIIQTAAIADAEGYDGWETSNAVACVQSVITDREMLAAAKIERLERERDGLRSELERAKADNAKLRSLLSVAKCPDCNGVGWYPRWYPGQISYAGDCEHVQCQWCDERNKLAKAKEAGL